MELSIDPETAETTAWGAWGALSFIALIAWCRWRGTPEDRKESKASQDAEKKRTVDAIEHELNKGDR